MTRKTGLASRPEREGILTLTVISVVVGVALAVAYHLFAAKVQSFAVRNNTVAGPAAVIAGFFIRLVVIVLIFFVLGMWSPLEIIPLVLSFAVLFTLLNAWSVYSLLSKRRNVPPSTGATGA